MKKIICATALIFAVVLTLSAVPKDVPWSGEQLEGVPAVFDGSGYSTNGVKALFYESLPSQGRATRVFAYYGIPGGASKEHKVPAMVLVHGGGGSAFHEWVKLWVDRGYAAISMDTCGAISGNGYNNHPRHAFGGPAGWGDFNGVDKPVNEQWSYHAVAAVVRAHSLLRSMEGVDPDRIGVTGVSWGGYLTCIAASIDSRFKFAAPVYGCGFLGDNSTWLGNFKAMGEEKSRQWLGLWDPSVYLPLARVPFLWVTGTNDFAYPMDSLQKSYKLLRLPVTLCIRPRMKHGQGEGAAPLEIYAFAEHFLNGKAALPEIKSVERKNFSVDLKYDAHQRKIQSAVLNYTCDKGGWKERLWRELPAVLIPEQNRVMMEIPECASTYYINLFTDDGLVVSSEHEEI
ncbi:MAG: acetylxylan esterase [Kiritimatiellae bacterium]|nr:acetylxylan esterase [Kiritimatiellia bacterium]